MELNFLSVIDEKKDLLTGIADRLWDHPETAFAETYAREHGKGAIILTTHVRNIRGQALYNKSGYTHLGTHTTGELLYIRYFEDEQE